MSPTGGGQENKVMKAGAFAEVEDVMSARVAWRDVEKMRPGGGGMAK